MTEFSWTERTDKRGLDPLGIQNPGVNLYQSLLPGISNVTLRVRYYGFYCWVSVSYAKSGATSDYKDWRTWIRRSEAALALICAHHRGEGGVGGIDWAFRRLDENEDVINFAEAASTDGPERYLAQDLGVFGGAYYTQMFEMGIFVTGEHGIQRATNVDGVALAAKFANSVGPEVEELLLQTIKTATVSKIGLDQLAPIVPSAIPETSEEREFYTDLLFAKNSDRPKDRSRATSLRLTLTTEKLTGALPSPDAIRWAMFSGQFEHNEMETQRVRWESYQCQDIFQVAAAALLEWSTHLMSRADGGSTLAQIAAEVRLSLGHQPDANLTWSAFRLTNAIRVLNFEKAWNTLTSRRGSTEEKALLAAQVMAAIDERLAARPLLKSVIEKELAVDGNARSIVTEIEWLARHSEATVSDVMAAYVTDRVVRRHSWVAMQKLRRQRDYTFLFELRDGRFVRRKGYAPAPTTPRLGPSVQFLEDLGLIGEDGLTPSGAAILGDAA